MNYILQLKSISILIVLGVAMVCGAADAQTLETPIDADVPGSAQPLSDHARSVIEYWTPDRIASAQPMQRILNDEGAPFMTAPDGGLVPVGHSVPLTTPLEDANDIQNSSHAAPVILDMTPNNFDLIGRPDTLQIIIGENATNVASVQLDIQMLDRVAQDYDQVGPEMPMRRGGFRGAKEVSPGIWDYELTALLPENYYSWRALITDQNGHQTWSPVATFELDVLDDPDRPEPIILAQWLNQGGVQTAAGRLLFEMYVEDEIGIGSWPGFQCSGTVVEDGAADRSIILTAAHCVYNEDTQTFTRNVIFIPNQAETTGFGSDRNCFNDPLGCWVASFGVIDRLWARKLYDPDITPEERVRNSPWDFGFYVIENTGAHAGLELATEALDEAVQPFQISFQSPPLNYGADAEGWAYALGYEGRFDPLFTYCAEGLSQEINHFHYYVYNLPNCLLFRGASGGPILSEFDPSTGIGKIISVNSYGYRNQAGMRGPKLHEQTAACRFEEAQTVAFNSILRQPGEEGYFSEGDCRFWHYFGQEPTVSD